MVDARDFPAEVEDFCVENDIPTHHDNGYVALDEEDGGALVEWLKGLGHDLSDCRDSQGRLHVAIQAT